jgi:hypothetical protein
MAEFDVYVSGGAGDPDPWLVESSMAAVVSALSQDMDEHVRKENTEVHPRFLELLKTATRR